MKNITLEELKNTLSNAELSSFEEEITKILNEVNADAKKLAAALLKKIEEVTPFQKREKVMFKRNPDAQRFFINIGSLEELTVTGLMDVVMNNVPGVERKDFSDVYIRDKFSFFELPKDRADEVLKSLNGVDYKNRHVRVELSEKREKKIVQD